MTPIKSLAMIKRSLEKALMCKSHVMIMIHSEWCIVFHMFAMGPASHLFFGGRRGWGGGRLPKEKQNHAQEKKEKKLVHKEAWENVYASLTYFSDFSYL